MTRLSYLHKTIVESKENLSTLKIFSRSSKILPWFLDKTLLIHNGRAFVPIQVTSKMINKRVGEFAYSKIRAVFRSKKKK
uniref:Ribosomal protein S19 n=1 Tax=Heterosigma akashiwo TaxID=2829 RepID=A0A1D8GXI2_HETAK|nr:ribosomal protein small subunit 19 [Heterosigma akashiwo]BBE28045.1 ribosomal protein S19 [Heterosigma akashiwo]